MRNDLIPVQVDDTTILVSAIMRGGEEEIAGVGAQSFVKVIKPVKAIANALAKSFKEIEPGRVAIEFGFDFAMDAGQLTALLVSASAQGSFKVTLEWTKDDQPLSTESV